MKKKTSERDGGLHRRQGDSLRPRVEGELALERYRELFDFAPIGYAILDGDGTIKEINRVGEQLLGRAASSLVGEPFAHALSREDLAEFLNLLERAKMTDKGEDCEIGLSGSQEAPSTDGRRRCFRLTARFLVRTNTAFLITFDDITQRKLHEERLIQTERALREVDGNKNEFLSALSHELRNPLSAIRMSLTALRKAEPVGEKAAKAHAILERQVTHLTRLVDDLLDLTRISRGKIELKRQKIELSDLIGRAIEDQRPSFEAAGIHLAIRFEPGAFWVDADPARVVQIVSNLLGNALKFTMPGGKVVVALRDENEQAMLSVSDSGVGIAPDVVPHVFERFVQAPQTSERRLGGLGLGLAVVKGLIELHGGTVRIASEGVGRGTEVALTFPLETAPPAPPSSAATPASTRRRVLVIDDNTDTAESLKEALALCGHDVMVAYDGPSGLSTAATFLPEVILCDIGLPGMDGNDVAKAIRTDACFNGIVLVAVSGYSQPTDRERSVAAGFDRHVAKPPSLETLLRIIAEAPRLDRTSRLTKTLYLVP
jgi:PAS domain S-box-containing protein